MDSKVLNNSCFQSKLQSAILKQYQNGDFTDAVLVTGFGAQETRIAVHRSILAASSEFFHTFFTTGLHASDQSEFRVGEIDGDTLRQLIDYCYTGRIALRANNVEQVLRWSHQYLIGDVVALCADYLNDHLTPENSFRLRALAKLLNISELSDTVERYFAEHFTKIAQTIEFKQMPLDELEEFLMRDDLNVDTEQQVLSAALNWIEHDRDARLQHFESLMFDYVRVMQVDDKFVRCNVEPLAIETNCVERLRSLLRNKVKRKPLDVERMFVIGGGSNVIEYFCPTTNKWKTWKTLPYAETKFDAVLHDGCIYAFYADTRKFAQIDLITMKIVREGVFRLYTNCEYHLIVQNDMICVFCAQSERHLRVVRFRRADLKLVDTKTLDVKIWDLNIAVSGTNVCIMGTVGKVEYEYVEVDVDDEEDDDNESEDVLEPRAPRVLNSNTRTRPSARNASENAVSPHPPPPSAAAEVRATQAVQEAASVPVANIPEPVPAPAANALPDDAYINTFKYDIERNALVPVLSFRDEHISAMAECQDFIYAVCCSSEDVWWECEVKRFNPKTNKLKKVLQFDEKRIGVTLFGYQGHLYVAGGGYSPTSESARVQRYNPVANEWQYMPSLQHARRRSKLLTHSFPKRSV